MAYVAISTLEKDTAVAEINKRYVFLVCAITALGGVLFGFDLVTISGAIQFVGNHFQLNDYEKGWAVGCINLGCIIGSILAGRLSDRWGRRKLLIFCAVLFIVTGVGTGFSVSFNMFVTVRILSGVAVGAAALVCPMYTAEISPAHLRGRMVSFYQLAITVGILLAYLSNYLLLNTGISNWRWMFTAQSVPALFFFIGLVAIAESPRWLIRKNRISEAQRILAKIGGVDYARQQVALIASSSSQALNERFMDILKKNVFPITSIGLVIAIFSQAVGQNSLFSYAPEIFKQAGMGVKTAFIQSFIIGIINFIFTFIAISLIDKAGRRSLLQFGSVLLLADALLLAAAFYFHWNGMWTLVFVLGFIAVYSSTIGPVTWVALSEIFPNRIRGNAMSAATLALWLTNFFTTASFPVLKMRVGLPGTFLIHGAICFIYFLFIQKRVPETKGKSLEEIEKILVK
ncbi:SP family arabinose:H+ symporter-like MFS transporter [Chitinophaga polysaccharea]|uniref:SP family arabinose:H+ symporter-like MFS transporter n=1 Tax=Chitinophaga polysaccharea TaxID=1293035 RepID=A0A561PQI3_9BACT|nr:sugar porter family MFS transporter [Chitinophaga polysaccharea]TWF40362.1 SP family arabinose:H+ symporter-like MFS transporter [Chitinophaga polysaccharea]